MHFDTVGRYFLLLLFVLSIAGCNILSSSDSLDEYREIAWNSLSDQEKETVIVDVDDFVVNVDDTYQPWQKDDAEPVPAVSVRINTSEDALLGPIVIYIDEETKEILGGAARF